MEDRKYQHYIVTRFNVKQQDWTDINSLLVLNENWLKERFELFEDFCFPSVEAQTCKDFKWLVYFDVDTPQRYRDLLESYKVRLPGFLPAFIPDMSCLISSIRDHIAADLEHDTAAGNTVVITTRLDNDDLLHEDFIQVVQSFIHDKQIEHGVIDIPNGYCLKTSPTPLLSTSTQFSNPFITFIEPYTSPKKLLTVMDRPHYKWDYAVETFFISHKRLWMQMIHEKNAFNKFQGIIINSNNALTSFNIRANIKFEKKTIKQLLFNSMAKLPAYFIKTQMKRMLIKQHNMIGTVK